MMCEHNQGILAPLVGPTKVPSVNMWEDRSVCTKVLSTRLQIYAHTQTINTFTRFHRVESVFSDSLKLEVPNQQAGWWTNLC